MENILNIEEHLYHFWLDHLEVYGSIKDENFLRARKTVMFLWYDFKESQLQKYLYKLTFSKDDNVLFAFYKWDWSLSVPTKDYVVIYATWFRMIQEQEILFFLAQFSLWKVRRFDIAWDVILPIENVLSQFWELKQKGATFNGKNGEVETRYIWEKQNTKNKRQLIRIYDKQVDIYARKKVRLYPDYLTQTHMTRVELEIRQELAKNIYYEDLFDVHHILPIYKNYLYKHTNLFESLPWDKITLFQKTMDKIDPELYQSIFYRNQRKNIFIGHAKSIYNFGFCPVRILLAEGYIQEKTKRMIGVDITEIITDVEKRVVENAKEQVRRRKDFQNLLDNSPEHEWDWE